MPFFYQSGEEIKVRDRVLLHGELGAVESIHDPADQNDWYVKKHSGGVMVTEPKVFGRLFIDDPADYEDLEFVSRSE